MSPVPISACQVQEDPVVGSVGVGEVGSAQGRDRVPRGQRVGCGEGSWGPAEGEDKTI